MAYFDNITLLVASVEMGGNTSIFPGEYVVKIQTCYRVGEGFKAFGEIPVVLPKDDTMTLEEVKSKAVEVAKDILGTNYPITVIEWSF